MLSTTTTRTTKTTKQQQQQQQESPQLTLMATRILFSYFLRDQKGQHFNEDLLAVNAPAFSFVLFFNGN